MTKIKFLVFTLSIIPLFSFAQSSTDDLFSCFDHYVFGSINLDSIAPEKFNYSPGEIINFKGLIENENNYPIVNGLIFARLIHLGSSENSFKYSDTVVDEFLVKENINILAGGAYPLTFEYKIPDSAPEGKYHLATYFIVARKFNLSGVSFLSNAYGGLTEFNIQNGLSLNHFLDRSSFKINGQEYVFRNFNPVFPSNTDITIAFQVKNTSDIQAQGEILYKFYKWDSITEEENLIQSFNEPISINPKKFSQNI